MLSRTRRLAPSYLSRSTGLATKRSVIPSPSASRGPRRGIGGRTFAASVNFAPADDASSRPFRSALYVPAINERALDKLRTLSGSSRPDAVVFDLEDGVGPSRKGEARENLLRFFQSRDADGEIENPGDYFGIVRINGVDTPWFEEDASMAMELATREGKGKVNGVLLPKVEGRKDVDFVSRHFMNLCDNSATSATPTQNDGDQPSSPESSPVSFWAMMETPRAILSALEIAEHPSIHGLILGTNDLCKDLGLNPSAVAGGREPLMASLQTTVLAARACRKIVLDGVYNNFRDGEGFRRECLRGKEWGMDGKTLIHPSQVSATNEIFAPSAEEVEGAERLVARWEEERDVHGGDFSGVAVLDGTMIERLHVDGARRLLERAERIQRTMK